MMSILQCKFQKIWSKYVVWHVSEEEKDSIWHQYASVESLKMLSAYQIEIYILLKSIILFLPFSHTQKKIHFRGLNRSSDKLNNV